MTQQLLIDHGRINLKDLLTDDPETFKQLKAFTATEIPKLSDRIQLYKGKEPLFRTESIEEQIEAAGEELVALDARVARQDLVQVQEGSGQPGE